MSIAVQAARAGQPMAHAGPRRARGRRSTLSREIAAVHDEDDW